MKVLYYIETVQITGYDIMPNAPRWACLLLSVYDSRRCDLLYTDALVYSAECLKYKQSRILNEIIQTSHKEEVVQQNLQWNCDFIMLLLQNLQCHLNTFYI